MKQIHKTYVNYFAPEIGKINMCNHNLIAVTSSPFIDPVLSPIKTLLPCIVWNELSTYSSELFN